MRKNELKIWIGVFFLGLAVVIYEIFKAIFINPAYFVSAFVMSLLCLVIWRLAIQNEFEKMYREYKEAGSLKALVKKWGAV